MFWRYLLLLMIVIVSTSCSVKKQAALETTDNSAMLSRQETKYLAYEHSFTVRENGDAVNLLTCHVKASNLPLTVVSA